MEKSGILSIPWRILPNKSTSTVAQTLLLKAQFDTASAYEVFLTDCVNLWCERLDHSAICERSKALETSIDPEEDSTQFRHLIDYLSQSFDPSMHQESLNLSRTVCSKKMLLKSRKDLPLPLKPLEWVFQLSLASADTFCKEFSHPIVSSVKMLLDQQEKLLSLLSEHDRLLSKIVGNSETSGVSINSTYPGLLRLQARTQQILTELGPDNSQTTNSYKVSENSSVFNVVERLHCGYGAVPPLQVVSSDWILGLPVDLSLLKALRLPTESSHSEKPAGSAQGAGQDIKSLKPAEGTNHADPYAELNAKSSKVDGGEKANLPASQNRKGPRKLGTIGARRSARLETSEGSKSSNTLTDEPVPQNSEGNDASSSQAAGVPADEKRIHDTQEDDKKRKADLRREQLKEELERKSKTGRKKQRRF